MKSSTLKTKGFKFKQFSIEGGQSGMPVSTDGVLLGAWAFEQIPTNILDIGTGTLQKTFPCFSITIIARPTPPYMGKQGR